MASCAVLFLDVPSASAHSVRALSRALRRLLPAHRAAAVHTVVVHLTPQCVARRADYAARVVALLDGAAGEGRLQHVYFDGSGGDGGVSAAEQQTARLAAAVPELFTAAPPPAAAPAGAAADNLAAGFSLQLMPPLLGAGAPALAAVATQRLLPRADGSEAASDEDEDGGGHDAAASTASAAAAAAAASPGAAASAAAASAGLIFLGTGAAAPSSLRSCSGVLVELGGDGGGGAPQAVLLDAGEGVLGRLRLAVAPRGGSGGGATASQPLPPALGAALLALRGVWVSHMHADHHTGLQALIWARACAAVAAAAGSGAPPPPPLLVSGPPLLARLLATHVALAGEALRELAPAGAPPLARFVELVDWPPALMAACAGLGGPAPARLRFAAFASVRVEHSCRDAFGAVLTLARGGAAGGTVVLAYSGDTVPCAAIVDAAAAAAAAAASSPVAVVLVHEATMDDARAADAAAKRHSTVGGALSVAARLRAALLLQASGSGGSSSSSGGGGGGGSSIGRRALVGTVLTHFSQRYASAPAAGAAAGAASRCLCALDLMRVPLEPVSGDAAAAGGGDDDGGERWRVFDSAETLQARVDAASGRQGR